jgi:phage tail-like protein
MQTAMCRENAVASERGTRLLASLPAVYGESDASGDLVRLLGVFEQLFFGSRTNDALPASPLPGIERTLSDIPAVLALEADDAAQGAGAPQAPDRFVQWLAAWLSFTPHALFAPPALRRIVAGIVPLNGLRGTRAYLSRLLELCFEGELARVEIDDEPSTGFTIGHSLLGRDTRLSMTGPFHFRVFVALQADAASPRSSRALERRLRAVIDYAKPAHTAYELHWED